MNKDQIISLLGIAIFIVAIPIYAVRESDRMERAQEALRLELISDGSAMYVENCARCHGAAGEGIGVMPGLNNPALAEADQDFLFKTIARASHGTTMAAWHIEEGGIYNDYQIDELVAVIRYADWTQVSRLAAEKGFTPPPQPAYETGVAYLETEGEPDPHQCAACHEDPALHAGQFGLNCARCHTTLAWVPAQLTRHTFLLDHGGAGKLACETCHVENYFQHSCYTCHDHQPEQMEQAHLAENISDYENCVACHPTGAPDEARQLMDQQVSQTDGLANYRTLLLTQPVSLSEGTK